MQAEEAVRALRWCRHGVEQGGAGTWHGGKGRPLTNEQLAAMTWPLAPPAHFPCSPLWLLGVTVASFRSSLRLGLLWACGHGAGIRRGTWHASQLAWARESTCSRTAVVRMSYCGFVCLLLDLWYPEAPIKNSTSAHTCIVARMHPGRARL